jgi:hypothetical protein
MRTFWVCAGSWLALETLSLTALRFSWLGALSCGLTVAVLYVAAVVSGARGWPLFRQLSFLYGGIGVLNIHFESVVFKITPLFEAAQLTAVGLAAALAISGWLAWAVTRDAASQTSSAPGPMPSRLWMRVLGFGLAYVPIFFTAGALILPYVRWFYQESGVLTMPSPGVVALTEVARGVIYALSLLPLFQWMQGRRLQAAAVAILALSSNDPHECARRVFHVRNTVI